MYTLPLTKGYFSIIDQDDMYRCNQIKWQIHNKGYAVSQGKILLHRFIMGAKKGQEIDHINQNKLDNRKCNLRFVTRSENQLNLPTRKNKKTKYKGVNIEARTGKYYSQLCVKGKRLHLGTFETAEQANQAYINKRRELGL